MITDIGTVTKEIKKGGYIIEEVNNQTFLLYNKNGEYIGHVSPSAAHIAGCGNVPEWVEAGFETESEYDDYCDEIARKEIESELEA